ncbi:TPR repeat-containing protein DDB_G0287407-like [Mytilus galloprovincialis]|uniref:TPR repeat-containing protein DDB_G0287407-like n=1 Tax=Mytilus edulis TaxID=6550 RepID=UPI0039F0DBE6
MATGGIPAPGRSKKLPEVPVRKGGKQKKPVKVFITTYSDEFYTERDIVRKEVLPELKSWCESKHLTVEEQFVKWGSKHPDRRDVTELEKIQTCIETCYFQDVMPIFINITSESVGWVPMWDECPDEVVENYIEAYGLVVEDLEVMNGAFRQDNQNSLFMMRNDDFLKNLPIDDQKYFLKKTPASETVIKIGDKISQKFPINRVVKYNCEEYKGLSSKNKPKLKLSDSFKQKILEFCKQRIGCDYCGDQVTSYSPVDNTVSQEHLTYMKNKSSTVIGRDDIIKVIEDYIFKEEKDVPLFVIGEAGIGKSSVMCKAAYTIYKNLGHIPCPGGKSWTLFFHFVGAIPGSCCLETMLKRLLKEADLVNDSSIPRGVEATAQSCCSMLANPSIKPIIIFIDGLNQFSDDQASKVMSWLPRKLAPHVRCIFSSVTDSHQYKTVISRESKPIELPLEPLDRQSRSILAKGWCKKFDQELTGTQLDALLSKSSSENLLWLSLACEEIKLVCDLDQIDKKINDLPEGLPNLFEYMLMRLENESGSNLVIGTLCLLEASFAGLYELELRQILGHENTLMPPSPFDEKDEKESSEKEVIKVMDPVSSRKWNAIMKTLQPYLRYNGESKEGRLDFYHRALSKAVRRRYFVKSEDKGAAEEHSEEYYWWHKKLAESFEHSQNDERFVEEYLYQLVCTDDTYRLTECLCDWRVFDKLYHEEYSSKLLEYWRKVGSTHVMINKYGEALHGLEAHSAHKEEAVSIRYEKVCRVIVQCGKYHDALDLLKTAMKIEEKELGARPHRMVELYALMAEIYDEKLKLNDFVSPSQLPDLRKTIHYGKKSIAIRKTLPGTYHKFKLGMSLMKLAFNLESWEACGGGPELTGTSALEEGNRYIDKALKIFQELNDMGHYAEALMTKGVLAKRGSMEQLKLYNEAMDLCMQMYGEYHILMSRLYINIGIVYEDNCDYKKAYEYFKKWARISEEILGPDHPKTKRARGVLRESRYQNIARNLDEWERTGHDSSPGEENVDETERRDLENFYDDSSDQNDINLVVSDCNQNLVSVGNLPNNEQDALNSEEEVSNGYFEEASSHDGSSSSSDNESENSDHENLYDDCLDEYAEQYAMINPIDDNLMNELNINIDDNDDVDDEIEQITSRENYDNEAETDNRYAIYAGDNNSENESDNCSNTRQRVNQL